jgi:N-acyl-D-aspartate/D-glutamate deacylase
VNKKFLIASLLLGLSLAAPIAVIAEATDYDVVIFNGRVRDPEPQFDGIRNVGVKDGKITTITKEKITGAKTIDTTGHVVAPGFIDTQAHSASSGWGLKLQLRDGVTTPMDFATGATLVQIISEKTKGPPSQGVREVYAKVSAEMDEYRSGFEVQMKKEMAKFNEFAAQ